MDTNDKAVRKANPRAKASPISALLFLHVYPLFWKNYKREMKEDDLFEVLEEDKSGPLGDSLEIAWQNAHKVRSKYALHWALFKVYGRQVVVVGLLRYVNEILMLVALPFSIAKLVTYFEKGPPHVTETEAYLYASATVLLILFSAVMVHPVMFWMLHLGMKMRVACCSLVYRKSLRLSATALGETTIGQVLNLTSNDVRKFDDKFLVSHYVWMAPLQAAIGTYLLYKVIGVSAFAGMGFLLMFVPLQMILGKFNSTIRLKTALRTDERVRLMNEILSGIQVIKMYAWEKPFAKLVAIARRYEIKQTQNHYYVESILYSLMLFATRAAIFISIVTYVYLGNGITADTAYSVTVIYGVLRLMVTLFFSFSIIGISELHISITRLQKFLEYDESPSDCLTQNLSDEKSPKIIFKGACAKWLKTSPDHNLNDINLTIEDKQLAAVIGAVGSGKTTLLNAILQEIPISTGFLEVAGTVSYASQEPWLFSASIRQNILFGDVYDEERYNNVMKVCALDTDLKMFPNGDQTVVNEKGRSLSGGQKARINLARCVYKHADIYLLDDPLSAVDATVGKQLYNECIKKFLSGKICILITHQLQYLKSVEKIIVMDEGKITADGNFQQLQGNGTDFVKLLQEFNEDGHQEQEMKTVKSKSSIAEEQNGGEVADNKETIVSGDVSCKTYADYLLAGGKVFGAFLALLILVASCFERGADYFLRHWVNAVQDQNLQNTSIDNEMIYTYSGIIFGTMVVPALSVILYFVYFMRVSLNIHTIVYNKISYATMKFFNDNPTARILNRFSKDLGIIDEYIPFILFEVIDISLAFLGSVVLSSIVNPYLVLPFVALMGIVYFARKIFLHTSRNVKRIEGITRTPIFNHMAASMNGLSTIRAFKAQDMLVKEFDTHQDLHSSAWHLFISSNRAFGMFLDFTCIMFIAAIIYSLLLINRGYYGGDVGLVVTQLIQLCGMLQWGVRQWSELENNMTSVERFLEYAKIDTEPTREITNVPKNWPEFGKIAFENVSLRYNSNEQPVLRRLTFSINPREKIGVVGRTGAGKSSTIAALFQLYDIEGSIVIDGIEVTQLALDVLRPKISIIPQEPVLFSGTIRKNLDPFDQYDDETVWNALEQVELKEVVQEAPGGLSSNVSEGGTNYSVGQRQLVCLARALIRRNRILVMDEATANVDPQTDSLIQKAIRKNFADCTVITIAHRLHTIMDSDKVLVVDHGKVVDFDRPLNLLENSSIFYNMVQATGNSSELALKAADYASKS